MQGIPDIVPPNPLGFKAQSCYFEMDGEPFAYYFQDPSTVTSVALYKWTWPINGGARSVNLVTEPLFWYGCGGGCCPAARYGLEPTDVYWINPKASVLHIFDILPRTRKVWYHPPSKDLPKISSRSASAYRFDLSANSGKQYLGHFFMSQLCSTVFVQIPTQSICRTELYLHEWRSFSVTDMYVSASSCTFH